MQEKEPIISVRFGWTNVFLGLLLGITRHHSAEPRDTKTMILGTNLSICTSQQSCHVRFSAEPRDTKTMILGTDVSICTSQQSCHVRFSAEPRDTKTMILGTDLSICTSQQSCHVRFLYYDMNPLNNNDVI